MIGIDRQMKCLLSQSVCSKIVHRWVSGPPSAFPSATSPDRGTEILMGGGGHSRVAHRSKPVEQYCERGERLRGTFPRNGMPWTLAGAPGSEDASPVGPASGMAARSRASRRDPSSSGVGGGLSRFAG
jgi:hypothetical protein